MEIKVNKPPTPDRLFGERMTREGRAKEFNARVKAVMADEGLAFFHARKKVMVEFGYEGPQRERELAEAYKAEQRAIVEREILGEVREETRARTFEEVVAWLPPAVSPAVELEWISSHPAMTRADRQSNATKRVTISADDILAAPNGKCPSQRAAHQLVHWANRTGEFWKQWLSENKKRIDDGGEQRVATADPGVGDIKAYLEQIQGAVSDV